MTLTLAIDGIVSVLLVITIGYAIVLNRRLKALRRDKAELQALVKTLAEASQSAEAGVQALKQAAEDVGRQLEKKVQDARSLRDDLAYMVDRGGDLADRLEGTIRTRRETAKPETPAARPVEMSKSEAASLRRIAASAAPGNAEPPSRPGQGAPSRAERELLRVLAGRR